MPTRRLSQSGTGMKLITNIVSVQRNHFIYYLLRNHANKLISGITSHSEASSHISFSGWVQVPILGITYSTWKNVFEVLLRCYFQAITFDMSDNSDPFSATCDHLRSFYIDCYFVVTSIVLSFPPSAFIPSLFFSSMWFLSSLHSRITFVFKGLRQGINNNAKHEQFWCLSDFSGLLWRRTSLTSLDAIEYTDFPGSFCPCDLLVQLEMRCWRYISADDISR